MTVLSNEISTDDLDRKFSYDSKDEIGIFAKTLKRMV